MIARPDDGIPATGVPAFDALAVHSTSFAQKLQAISREGFEVVRDTTLEGRAAFSRRRFVYNPRTLTRLDLAHEWRHFVQIRQLNRRGIRLKSRVLHDIEGPAELGAYGWERRVWTRAQSIPSRAYLQWHADRVRHFEGLMMRYRSLQAKRYGARYRGIRW